METDELKMAWKELNKRVEASELANKKTLTYILEAQRKTALQKMVEADRAASLLLFLLTIVMGYFLFSENYSHLSLLMRILVVTVLPVTAIINTILYLKLTKMDLNGSPLLLYKQIASYKRLTVWVYWVAYTFVVPFMVVWFILEPPIFAVKVTLCILIPLCFVIDYFMFHRLSGQIRTLIETTRELKDLHEETE